MLAGLDVGGTHTDAALMKEGRCVAFAKAPTRRRDPLPGMLEALAALFSGGLDPASVRRLTVSTTLGLNALLTGDTDPVGMLAVPGPGLDPALFWPSSGSDPLFRVLGGAQDHRGRVVAPPDPAEAEQALRAMKELGARAVGVAVKFSPKNPEPERELGRMAADIFGPGTPVVLGASVSGSLNFPRRLHTVWCNAALAATGRRFADALAEAAAALGLACPVFVLKADAGSFSIESAAHDTAATMGSGPAASLLGVWALSGVSDDALMIDMGGTSTDLALLADGQPLLSRRGLCAAGRQTLIRTLCTSSLAVGGDSSLRVAKGGVSVGPDRSGPALALGGALSSGPEQHPPALTDAMNVLGLCAVGDTDLSREALLRLARDPGCPSPARGDAPALARLFVDAALELVRRGAEALLEEVNARPVYTIKELLVDKKLHPARAVFIGGPAEALAAGAAGALGMPVLAPPGSAYANAVGAALARPTRSAELYADTLLGRMSIPDFGVEKSVDRHYDLPDAKADMLAAFAAADAPTAFAGEGERDARHNARHSDRHDARHNDWRGAARIAAAAAPADGEAHDGEAQIVFAERFAVLDPEAGRGRILRVRAQRAAGLAMQGVAKGAAQGPVQGSAQRPVQGGAQ